MRESIRRTGFLPSGGTHRRAPSALLELLLGLSADLARLQRPLRFGLHHITTAEPPHTPPSQVTRARTAPPERLTLGEHYLPESPSGDLTPTTLRQFYPIEANRSARQPANKELSPNNGIYPGRERAQPLPRLATQEDWLNAESETVAVLSRETKRPLTQQ